MAESRRGRPGGGMGFVRIGRWLLLPRSSVRRNTVHPRRNIPPSWEFVFGDLESRIPSWNGLGGTVGSDGQTIDLPGPTVLPTRPAPPYRMTSVRMTLTSGGPRNYARRAPKPSPTARSTQLHFNTDTFTGQQAFLQPAARLSSRACIARNKAEKAFGLRNRESRE